MKQKLIAGLADLGVSVLFIAFQNFSFAPVQTSVGASDFVCSANLFTNLREVTIIGVNQDAMEPFISPDGRFLYFNNSNAPGSNTDIQIAARVDDLTFRYLGPLNGANSGALDGAPSVDLGGNLYFTSLRNFAVAGTSQFTTPLFSGFAPLKQPVAIDKKLVGKSGWVNMDLGIAPDGLSAVSSRAFFEPNSPTPSASYLEWWEKAADGWRLSTLGNSWLVNINADGNQRYAPALSYDGRELYFTQVNAENGIKTYSIMMTCRTSGAQPFSTATKVASATGKFTEAPTITRDGRRLYFHALRDGVFRIFTVARP